MKHLAKNIKYLRKRERFNQTEVGEAVGISKAMVSGYENGTNTPGVETLCKIANFFQVLVDDLLFRDIENKGISGEPIEQITDEKDLKIIKLMEQRIKVLEREVKRTNPGLADELGI